MKLPETITWQQVREALAALGIDDTEHRVKHVDLGEARDHQVTVEYYAGFRPLVIARAVIPIRRERVSTSENARPEPAGNTVRINLDGPVKP